MSPLFFEYFLIFWHSKIFQSQFLLFLPLPWFILVENGFWNQNLGAVQLFHFYQSPRCKGIAPGHLHLGVLSRTGLSLLHALVVSLIWKLLITPAAFFHCCLFCCLFASCLYILSTAILDTAIFSHSYLLALSMVSCGQNAFVLI